MMTKPIRNLLILAAMAEEEAALLKELAAIPGVHSSSRKISPRLGIEVQEFTVGARRVQIARSGIGPVNAALTVAMIFEQSPPPDEILLLGVGGSLTPELEMGELVISDRIIQHDSFSSLDTGDHRMRAGDYILSIEEVAHKEVEILADPELSTWLEERSRSETRVHRGAILSGNEFVGRSARKLELARLHPRALLVDMEAAGVAQIAHRLGVPFVVAKTVADRLHPDGSISTDFSQSLEAAAANAARALRIALTHP